MAYHKWTDEERAELLAATSGLEGQALTEVLRARGVDRSFFYRMRRHAGKKIRHRHRWTDSEKQELVAAMAGLGKGALTEALRKRGINSTSWFYRVRKEHGEPQAAPVPAVRLVNESFRDASRERKRELVEELKNVEGPQQKDEWCRMHGVTRSAVYYWSMIFGREAREGKKKLGRPRKDASEKALAVRAFLNGPESRPPEVYPLHPLPVARVEGFTLHEAITAMEVKRDHMTEFIEEIKRMQRNAR
jgi:transposase-like protein